jgi:hypothetical protein
MRRAHTTHTRDAALRQLKRINRWLIAGSVVLAGVLADVAANAFPGKTTNAASTSSKPSKASKTHSKHAGGASKSTTGVLRAPEQAPRAGSEAQAAPTEPAQEAAPQESAPPQEAPVEQAAPEAEQAPAQEAAPSREAAPEESGPVVSGGS